MLVVPIAGTQQTVQHDVEQIVHVNFDSESLPFVSEIHSFIFVQNHKLGELQTCQSLLLAPLPDSCNSVIAACSVADSCNSVIPRTAEIFFRICALS